MVSWRQDLGDIEPNVQYQFFESIEKISHLYRSQFESFHTYKQSTLNDPSEVKSKIEEAYTISKNACLTFVNYAWTDLLNPTVTPTIKSQIDELYLTVETDIISIESSKTELETAKQQHQLTFLVAEVLEELSIFIKVLDHMKKSEKYVIETAASKGQKREYKIRADRFKIFVDPDKKKKWHIEYNDICETITKMQLTVIEILFDAYEEGKPVVLWDVINDALTKIMKAPSSRELKDVFKENKKLRDYLFEPCDGPSYKLK